MSVLTFTDTGLPPSTVVSYTVSAVNQFGEGPQSAPATTTTLSALPLQPTVTTAVLGTTSIQLNWNNVGGSTYLVSRTGATPVTVSGLTFTDTGLTPGTSYTYRVAGINSSGTGPQSAPITATTVASLPTQPTVMVTVLSAVSIQLNWNNVGGATYQVSRNGAAPVSVSVLTYTDNAVVTGTSYTYTVAGVNSSGTGPAGTATVLITSNIVILFPNPTPQLGVGINAVFTMAAAGGTAPYTFSMTGPSWGAMDTAGDFTATNPPAGTSSFTVTATDSSSPPQSGQDILQCIVS